MYLYTAKWSRMTDLNPRPTDYKSVALPTELIRHIKFVAAAPRQASSPLINFKFIKINLHVAKDNPLNAAFNKQRYIEHIPLTTHLLGDSDGTRTRDLQRDRLAF